MAPAGETRGATWRQKLSLALLSPIVFVLIGEGAVRLTGIDTDLARNENFEIAVPVWLLADPGWVDVWRERLDSPSGVRAEDVAWLRHFEEARYIQYRLKPGIDVAAVNPFNEIDVEKHVTFRLTSNTRGFRGPEIAPTRAGVRRAISFGDSSTFGWGVDLEHTFQAQLAARLSRDGSRWEVLNFGMPGFTSRHGTAVQRYYANDLDADIAIISYGANDARLGLTTTDAALDVDDTWVASVAWGLRRFELFKLLRRGVLSAYDPFANASSRRRGAESKATTQAVPMEAYRAHLTQMTGIARQAGADDVVLLSVCAPDDYRYAMREVAAQRDAIFVDALELFVASVDRLKAGELYRDEIEYYIDLYGIEAMTVNWRYYVTTDGCHPNRAGHALIADAMAEGLAARRQSRHP